MDKIRNIWESIFVKISIYYIEFVYKTSKIIKVGNFDLLEDENEEKFVIGFWHGDSYCFFPLLKESKNYIITTRNRRGDYISHICKHFGYSPIRVSDESIGGNFLFKIRNKINEGEKGNLALTLDGPLGPYHVPKKFALLTALFSKRRMLPLSIKVNRKIQLMKRWDRYLIPFPFNTIEIQLHEPMEIKKEEIDILKEKIIHIMEN